MADFPEDYLTLRQFHSLHPNVHTSVEALRWELRFRQTNGLMTIGSVIERRADPKATRPKLLISPSRYFAWLRGSSRGWE